MEKDAASRARKTGGVYLAPFVARNVETGVVSMCADEPTVKSDDAFMAVVRCFEEKALGDPKADATVPVPLLEGMIQEYMKIKISAKQQTLSTLSDPRRSPEYQYTFELLALGSSLNFGENSACTHSLNFGVYAWKNLGRTLQCRWHIRGRRPVRYSLDCYVMNRLWICLWRCYHRSTGVFGALFGAWDSWVRCRSYYTHGGEVPVGHSVRVCRV